MEGFAGQARRAEIHSGSGRARLSTVLALVAGLLAFAAVGCASSTATSTPPPASATKTSTTPVATTKDYANPDLLVETEWLASNLTDTNLRIVDVRKADDYKKGHIKGAISIPIDTTYPAGGPQAMPETPEKIAQLLGSKGIGNDNRVVIYTESKEYIAARLFWELEYYGHKKVSVLNGGFKKWQKENKETATAEPTITAVTFTARVNTVPLAIKDDMLATINNSNVAIVDNRAPAEYTGAEPNAKRGGHIPKAVNIDWVHYFNPDDTFKSATNLSKLYEEKGIIKDKKEVITYCQVGLRSAVGYFTLRLLGFDNVRHYIASWSDWGNDGNVPIEK